MLNGLIKQTIVHTRQPLDMMRELVNSKNRFIMISTLIRMCLLKDPEMLEMGLHLIFTGRIKKFILMSQFSKLQT